MAETKPTDKAWQQEHFTKSFELAKKALELDPAHFGAYVTSLSRSLRARALSPAHFGVAFPRTVFTSDLERTCFAPMLLSLCLSVSLPLSLSLSLPSLTLSLPDLFRLGRVCVLSFNR